MRIAAVWPLSSGRHPPKCDHITNEENNASGQSDHARPHWDHRGQHCGKRPGTPGATSGQGRSEITIANSSSKV